MTGVPGGNGTGKDGVVGVGGVILTPERLTTTGTVGREGITGVPGGNGAGSEREGGA